MAKQNVFNFETMQFELVECDDLLSLIDDLNAECAAQQSFAPDLACACGSKSFYNENDARLCVRCGATQPSR